MAGMLLLGAAGGGPGAVSIGKVGTTSSIISTAVGLLWQIEVVREDTQTNNQCFFPVHMF